MKPFQFLTAALSVATLVACSHDDTSSAASSEQDYSSMVTPGAFRLYPDAIPNIDPTCDRYTRLDLGQGANGPVASLAEVAEGCSLPIDADHRMFYLTVVDPTRAFDDGDRDEALCGTRIYEGTAQSSVQGEVHVRIIDQRQRHPGCAREIASDVIVEETPTIPGNVTKTLYSH